jgi:hypothetical protein
MVLYNYTYPIIINIGSLLDSERSGEYIDFTMPIKKIWLSKKSLKFNARFIIICTYHSKKKSKIVSHNFYL